MESPVVRAERRLRHFLRRAQAEPSLARRVPGGKKWETAVQIAGNALMRRLNRDYRQKDAPTDVLSFPAPAIFRTERGVLGELVLCLPVLRRQAREQGHSVERELDILLVHGLLHLLGFDHERGPRAAKVMADWESRLLGKGARSPSKGLIGRTHSGNR